VGTRAGMDAVVKKYFLKTHIFSYPLHCFLHSVLSFPRLWVISLLSPYNLHRPSWIRVQASVSFAVLEPNFIEIRYGILIQETKAQNTL
jgi:hypothetical protein